MVAVRPFCALRYNPAVAGDLSPVIAPPYDVIDAPEQERLYAASPYNIVRLILGKQSPGDTEDDNRYTRARRDFNAWRAQGVLQRDPAPAVYLIEHAFTPYPGEAPSVRAGLPAARAAQAGRNGGVVPEGQPPMPRVETRGTGFTEHGRTRSRLGFIALLQLDDAAERAVYRHEATLDAPKADRTKLLEAVPANLSPVFCIYPDDGGALQALLQERSTRAAPSAHGVLNGDEVRVWALTDPETLEAVRRHLASVAVLIADGHHRFEVACAHRSRYGAVMTYFVSMADPSLVMRPIHRIVRTEARLDVQSLARLCSLEPAADLAALTRWLEGGEGSGRFGCYDGRGLYQVRVLEDPRAQWLKASSVPPPLAALDVSLLHGLILPRLRVNGSGVRYTPQADEAMRAVDRGEGTCAWLLRGLPLAEVYALAAQGLTLPPKSTYFYPKVFSGLTINPFD